MILCRQSVGTEAHADLYLPHSSTVFLGSFLGDVMTQVVMHSFDLIFF